MFAFFLTLVTLGLLSFVLFILRLNYKPEVASPAAPGRGWRALHPRASVAAGQAAGREAGVGLTRRPARGLRRPWEVLAGPTASGGSQTRGQGAGGWHPLHSPSRGGGSAAGALPPRSHASASAAWRRPFKWLAAGIGCPGVGGASTSRPAP